MTSDYLEITYNNVSLDTDSEYCGILPFCNSTIFTQSIIDHSKLTSGDDVKNVYEVTIDTMGVDHTFYPGDAIGILAHNNTLEVNQIMEILDLNEENYSLSILKTTTKKKAGIPVHIPQKGSVRSVFEKCLDIRSIPKKAFLKMLLQYTTNEEEKAELLMLSSPKSENYNTFISNEGKTLLTLLRKFPTCKPPFERLLEHLPALKPRFYSISSSDTHKLRIAFSVIENHFQNDCGDTFTLSGVCTSYLEALLQQSNRKIQFYFRQSTNFLSFEPEFNSPLILIGPGTGVAPFRGFLQAQSQHKDKTQIENIYLFYGCRYSDRDYLYKSELNEYVDKGILTALYVAFSRETNKKVYVQDKIKEQGELIADLILNGNAHVRVCGDAVNLPKAIDQVLTDVIVEFGRLDRDESKEFVNKIKSSGRYMTDAWV